MVPDQGRGRTLECVRLPGAGRVTGLETFCKICLDAVQECGPGSDIAAIEKAVLRRVEALPPEQRRAVESHVKALVSYEPPGFHEHGSH